MSDPVRDPVRFEFDGEDTVTRGFNAVPLDRSDHPRPARLVAMLARGLVVLVFGFDDDVDFLMAAGVPDLFPLRRFGVEGLAIEETQVR